MTWGEQGWVAWSIAPPPWSALIRIRMECGKPQETAYAKDVHFCDVCAPYTWWQMTGIQKHWDEERSDAAKQ